MNKILRLSASNYIIRNLHKCRNMSGVPSSYLFTNSGRTPGIPPQQKLYSLKKNFSSSPNGDRFPKLTDFPIYMWPQPFEMIRHRITSSFVIRRYIDKDFDLDEFVKHTKHVVVRVAGYIAEEKLIQLDELVTQNVLEKIKKNIKNFSLKHRVALGVEERDIFFSFTHNVEVIIPGEVNIIQQAPLGCYVQITVVHLAVKDIEDSDASKTLSFQDFRKKFHVLNYRFVRCFAQGKDSYWIINGLNHAYPLEG